MTAEFHIILPDCSNQSIALLVKNGAFSLPGFKQESELRYNTVTGINEQLREAWQIEATVSRCVLEGHAQSASIFALHNHDQSWHPEPFGAGWVSFDEIPNINFENIEHRERIIEWIESLNDPAWKHVPWSSPDWAARAVRWMNESIAQTGASVIPDRSRCEPGPYLVFGWSKRTLESSGLKQCRIFSDMRQFLSDI